MGGPVNSISPQDLYDRIGTAAAPPVIDVRRRQGRAADDRLIAGAIGQPSDEVERWRRELPADGEVVLYCEDGAGASAALAATLTRSGCNARALSGGLSRWRELGLPTMRRLDAAARPWITRARPKVDRIACPWLIRRFINRNAELLYVTADTVARAAADAGATLFDVDGAEFGHLGDQCSFDAFLRLFEIRDPPLDRLARIVRGADTGKPELSPQSPGLLAISQGLSNNFVNDFEMLAHGMVVYDALYAWCRQTVANA
jgi:rhodanese-related sulfurtransferase